MTTTILKRSYGFFSWKCNENKPRIQWNSDGPPLWLDGVGSTRKLKPKQEWDKVDNEDSERNVKALYSTFYGVSPNEFHIITTCKLAKEAKNTLSNP